MINTKLLKDHSDWLKDGSKPEDRSYQIADEIDKCIALVQKSRPDAEEVQKAMQRFMERMDF